MLTRTQISTLLQIFHKFNFKPNLSSKVIKIQTTILTEKLGNQNRQTILVISLSQKQYLENIWRRYVLQNSIYNSPSSNLWVSPSFENYSQKYDRSRRYRSSRSPGMKRLNSEGSKAWRKAAKSQSGKKEKINASAEKLNKWLKAFLKIPCYIVHVGADVCQ